MFPVRQPAVRCRSQIRVGCIRGGFNGAKSVAYRFLFGSDRTPGSNFFPPERGTPGLTRACATFRITSGYDPGFIRVDKITYAVHMDCDDWNSAGLGSTMVCTETMGLEGTVCVDCSGIRDLF
jgi:hypothetical protein